MSTGATQEGARRALREVQRYLADEIAPLMAAESFGVVLRLSPALAVAAIEHWLEEQLRAPDCAASASGYLYHAVKKLHLLSEFDLLDRSAVERYLVELSRLLVARCPEHERAELRVKLGRMGEVETTLSAPIELLNRERESEGIGAALKRPGAREWTKPDGKEGRKEARPGDAKIARAAVSEVAPSQPATIKRRLNSFLRRLHEIRANPRDAQGEAASRELLAHLLSKAAIEASDPSQLDAFLARVPNSGVVPRLDRAMFRVLGDRLPGWEVDAPGAGAALGHILQGMHRLVSLAPSREEGSERFGEMVYAAIEKHNEGHLAQAVAMLDVAERLIAEGKIDPQVAQAVRERAQGAISLGPVRQFASTAAKHGLLRKVLRFFPDFSPDSLLEHLDGEPRRETRKLMLSLLEVHGPPCRPKIVERLHRYRTGELPDPHGFYSRNAVFLIRRIPRGTEQDPEREIVILAEMCRPGRPFLVVREALTALGQVGLKHAEKVLAECLDLFERDALGNRPAYVLEESSELLDRTCAALARVGTRAAVRRVIRHAFREEPRLGEPFGRLDHLAGCDLSTDPEQLLELLDALRGMLPSRVLGIVLGSAGPEPAHLVRALAGTRMPLVERLFEEIVTRFPGRDFAKEAQEALAKMRASADPGASHAEGILGDLEVFGLPTLFQSLADAESTGRLVIAERNGSERGTVFFLRGRILGCEVGRLRGLDAVCQLFECPRQGAFRFERAPAEQLPQPVEEPFEVLPTVLEAIRRHDELQGDSALVPDGTSLAPTATAPAFPPDEEDRELVRVVWREASSGTAPESCEGRVAADSYRVRRLYAHWFEQGALERRRAA